MAQIMETLQIALMHVVRDHTLRGVPQVVPIAALAITTATGTAHNVTASRQVPMRVFNECSSRFLCET
jgi:hypothetical protein